MKNKLKKIVVIGDGFIEWGGGIDFLKNIIDGLLKIENCEIYFLARTDNCLNFKHPFKALHRFFPGFILQWFFPKKLISLKSYSEKIHFKFYNFFPLALWKISPTIIIPTTIIRKFKYPWVGYLYDCQHKHLPGFFSKEVISGRDEFFTKMLESAPALIVNSKDTKKDLINFFLADEDKIFNLPFAPILKDTNWLRNLNDSRVFELPEAYFIVSNQFWIHKSHETVFRALGYLKNVLNVQDIKIVCTGLMKDDRSPDYIQRLNSLIKELGLERDIIFLGYIDKKQQIEALKGSLAIIQPTLFEGGPGGGVTFDATALDLDVILSDIPVNLEISGLENLTYFKAGDSQDLAKKMNEKIVNPPRIRKDESHLIEQSEYFSRELSNGLEKVIDYAITKYECAAK